jgi:hypothetical protein
VKPETLAEGFDVILATPERVLVSQHRPDDEGLISILKCLKLTIDIIFKSHFIAHLARSNAKDQSGFQIHVRSAFYIAPCTNVDDVFQARQRFSRQIKWTICIGFFCPWILY